MIHLLAEIKAFPDSAQQVQALLEALLEPSRKEEGCCQYELYRDNSIEGLFLMQEIWCSEESLQKHQQSDHFQHFQQKIGEREMLEYLQLRPLTFVG
ncbi:putative quinol monooxygenase [Vibrio cholerae]